MALVVTALNIYSSKRCSATYYTDKSSQNVFCNGYSTDKRNFVRYIISVPKLTLSIKNVTCVMAGISDGQDIEKGSLRTIYNRNSKVDMTTVARVAGTRLKVKGTGVSVDIYFPRISKDFNGASFAVQFTIHVGSVEYSGCGAPVHVISTLPVKKLTSGGLKRPRAGTFSNKRIYIRLRYLESHVHNELDAIKKKQDLILKMLCDLKENSAKSPTPVHIPPPTDEDFSPDVFMCAFK